MMPRSMKSMISGLKPTLIGCAPMPSTTVLILAMTIGNFPRDRFKILRRENVRQAAQKGAQARAFFDFLPEQRGLNFAEPFGYRIGSDFGEVEGLGIFYAPLRIESLQLRSWKERLRRPISQITWSTEYGFPECAPCSGSRRRKAGNRPCQPFYRRFRR